MVQNQPRKVNLPQLQSINRINNFPIVETGWSYAGQLYNRLKVKYLYLKYLHCKNMKSIHSFIKNLHFVIIFSNQMDFFTGRLMWPNQIYLI